MTQEGESVTLTL